MTRTAHQTLGGGTTEDVRKLRDCRPSGILESCLDVYGKRWRVGDEREKTQNTYASEVDAPDFNILGSPEFIW